RLAASRRSCRFAAIGLIPLATFALRPSAALRASPREMSGECPTVKLASLPGCGSRKREVHDLTPAAVVRDQRPAQRRSANSRRPDAGALRALIAESVSDFAIPPCLEVAVPSYGDARGRKLARLPPAAGDCQRAPETIHINKLSGTKRHVID